MYSHIVSLWSARSGASASNSRRVTCANSAPSPHGLPAGIDCGSACAAPFDLGTPVTLTALPAAGSVFDGWSGEGCAGTGVCTVAMTQARSVQATFRLVPAPAPKVTGLSPDSGPAGTSVTITGTGLGSARDVFFGVRRATFVVDRPDRLTAVVPAGQTGTTDVRVVTALGTSQPTSASAFTYTDAATAPSDAVPVPVPVARRVVCGRIPSHTGHTARRARAILARDGCAGIRVRRLNKKRKPRARVVRQSVAPRTPVFEGDSKTVFVRLR
jgi:hypothetical protein